jgi:DNA-binding transcriptional ArsR family regulator
LSSGDGEACAEISGKTLLVYFYLLRKRQNCSVRDIQRALGFSSPSSAYYHLEKLEHSGVLTKDAYGNYRINEVAKVWLMDRFLIFHGFLFPKQLIYATGTSAMCIFFALLLRDFLTLTVVLALLPGIVGSGILWYDAAEAWLSLPSFKKERSMVLEGGSNV